MEPVAMRKDKVLLVEDDHFQAKITAKRLEEWEGFDVTVALDGQSGWELFNSKKFDICLLDVVMPKLNGFELSERIRKVNQDVIILFLTSKGVLKDRITGLRIGADDYITKPFSMEELILRMNVFLKRIRPQRLSGQAIYRIRDYRLDMEQLTLTKGDVVKRMTPKEAQVLLFLVKNINQVISRGQILLGVWGKDDYFFGRSLDVYITKLRKHFSEDKHILIESRWNVGYILQIVDGI